MKKVFMQFGSGLGPMSRTLPIALELAKAGFEIRYLGYTSARPYMEAVGIKEISSDFSIADIVKGDPNPHWNSADTFWTMIGYGNEDWLESKIQELIPIVREYNPDYIFSDLGILACIVARILKIPLIAMNQSCYFPGNTLKWWDNNVYEENQLRDKLNKLLKKYNAKRLNTFTEIFTGDITVIPSFPEFDFIPVENLKKYNAHYIGPILWFDNQAVDDEVQGVFENTKRKKLFCYTARFIDNVGKSGEVIFNSILSIAKDIDAEIILSTGSKLDYEKAMKICGNQYPDNLHIVNYVPLEIAYGKSDLIIHHGGHGSCLGHFYFGVNGLIIPTHTEREYNARVCKKLGIADFIQREELSKSNMINTINSLLVNTEYQITIKKFQEKIKPSFNKLDSFIDLIK